jgi:hypothetical protein
VVSRGKSSSLRRAGGLRYAIVLRTFTKLRCHPSSSGAIGRSSVQWGYLIYTAQDSRNTCQIVRPSRVEIILLHVYMATGSPVGRQQYIAQ